MIVAMCFISVYTHFYEKPAFDQIIVIFVVIQQKLYFAKYLYEYYPYMITFFNILTLF